MKRTILRPHPLTVRAVQLHADLMRAGLLRTGQKMHDVVREIGYELAGIATPTRPEEGGG